MLWYKLEYPDGIGGAESQNLKQLETERDLGPPGGKISPIERKYFVRGDAQRRKVETYEEAQAIRDSILNNIYIDMIDTDLEFPPEALND